MYETKMLTTAFEGHSSVISHTTAVITGHLHILDYSYTKPLYLLGSFPSWRVLSLGVKCLDTKSLSTLNCNVHHFYLRRKFYRIPMNFEGVLGEGLGNWVTVYTIVHS